MIVIQINLNYHTNKISYIIMQLLLSSTYIRDKFHTSKSSDAFKIFMSTAKANVRTAAKLLLYIIQKYYLNISCTFLSDTTDVHPFTT
jgi:predicted ATPase